MKSAIGGYFELELPLKQTPRHHEALKFQSARAAFLSLLRAIKPKRVWMPHYICDSMLAPIAAIGANISFYKIDERFGVDKNLKIFSDEIILYVNYFGLCSEQVNEVLNRFNFSQVVLDYSQAFFSDPVDCLATIYSPRKFFGIPDGGLLFTKLDIDRPKIRDESSEFRMRHLIARLGKKPEDGYVDFQNSEKSLNDFEPKEISQLTERIMASIDFQGAETRRRVNFDFLNNRLSKINKIIIDKIPAAPLCYPLLCPHSHIREKLINNRIFPAAYWPDVSSRVEFDSIEFNLAKNLVAIPCDQRYSVNDLEFILSIIGQ